MTHYIGVDVGTGSVRAAVVGESGEIIATAVEEINTWNPKPDHYEQSSDNIWQAVCKAVLTVLTRSGVDRDAVKGVGFDATCSLVVLDAQFQPVSVSRTGAPECNVVLWMDHRAAAQADAINKTGSDVLRYVGGKMSLEMQMPKLCWLKQNLMDTCWSKAAHFFDLPDFLTWRATGSLSRSLCCVVCKWGYVAGTGWDDDFLKVIGLDDLIQDNYCKIGNKVQAPGEPCGEGLSAEAATELGLNAGTPVGTSLIDAHAGGVGCLGCLPTGDGFDVPPLTQRLVLICGTSSCHMTVRESCTFVSGVWGPYFSAILPGFWTHEGGQSATGKLIDFVVENHPAYTQAVSQASERGIHIHTLLNEHLKVMQKEKGRELSELTSDLHIWPDYHGNRSPIADPTLKGMISGLTLSAGMDDLALLYLATIQSLSYGTLHILTQLELSGQKIGLVYLCGGLRNNELFVSTTADVLNLPVVLPNTTESVLLGAAILGARASGTFTDIQGTLAKMGGKGQVVQPNSAVQKFHQKKYKVFLKMLSHQREYTEIMSS